MRSCAQFSANSYTLVHASRRLNAVIFVLTRSAIRPHRGGTIQRARCLSQYEDDDDYQQGTMNAYCVVIGGNIGPQVRGQGNWL